MEDRYEMGEDGCCYIEATFLGDNVLVRGTLQRAAGTIPATSAAIPFFLFNGRRVGTIVMTEVLKK